MNKFAKALPITLGVIIVVLLGILAFVPGKKGTPSENSTSTPATSTPDNTTPSTTLPDGNPTSTLHAYTTKKGKTVNVYLASGQKVVSPLTITGNVPAGWAFEASFPVSILDANGTVLGQGPARVPNWMSTTTAWFGVTVSFPKPATATGTLLLRNDNPSGEAANADEIRIPVTF